MSSPLAALLRLSRDLGREDRGLAILAEGNASAQRDDGSFFVKASGTSLATLAAREVTSCRFDRLLPLLERGRTTDAEVDAALLAARERPSALKPSVEAVFHAWLLTLPGVRFVGHTHPVSVNGLLCSGRGRAFAQRRLFPDEVVCCGEASVFVPYADPGLKLAQAIRRETRRFVDAHGQVPRLLLLENHGLIAVGSTPQAVLAATLMADKAAKISLHAATLGGGRPPHFLTPAQVRRIAGRPDEAHRRRMLRL